MKTEKNLTNPRLKAITMAENKRVAVFFIFILLIIAGFIAWLALVQPTPVQTKVVKEIPNERIFTK